MQKEELLHLHMLMVHIKKYYEHISGETVPTERYEALDVSPVHIHKNKKLHKDALLVLGDEIVSQIRSHKTPIVEYSSDMVVETVAIEH